VAFEGADAGGLHPGRSATHHGDLPGSRRSSDPELVLAAYSYVHGTPDGLRGVVAPGQATVVAADAGPDVLGPAFQGLPRPLGIGPQGPSQGDEVALALRQDALGQRRQVDRPGGDHREADLLLDGLGRPHVVRERHAHRAYFVDRLVVIPAGHVDGGHPQGLQAFAELDGLLDGVAIGLVIGAAHSHADGVVGSYLLLDLGDDFQQEAHAVLERAAVPVGALVGPGGEEVGDEVPVAGVDLDHVEVGGLGPLSGLPEVFDDLQDLGEGQFLGSRAALSVYLLPRYGRGRFGCLQREALPAGV